MLIPHVTKAQGCKREAGAGPGGPQLQGLGCRCSAVSSLCGHSSVLPLLHDLDPSEQSVSRFVMLLTLGLSGVFLLIILGLGRFCREHHKNDAVVLLPHFAVYNVHFLARIFEGKTRMSIIRG